MAEETVNTPETNVTPPVVGKPTPESKTPEKPIQTAKTDATGAIPKPEKYKVKVLDKEEEVTLDELRQGYMHGSAANKKMQEAAKIRKESEEFVHRLKTDPMGLLEDPRLGVNAREKAEEYLLKKMEYDAMNPEQKELVESKMKLAKYEAEKKAAEKAKLDAESMELSKKYSEDYQKEIATALNGAGLPKTEHTVRRMAYYMLQGIDKGYNLKAIDVVPLVKEDYQNDIKSLFGELDGETLLGLLGDGVAEKISKHQISKIKTVGKKVAATEQGQKEDDAPKSKKITKEEWRKKLDAI
jgi:hypothetical protein